MKKSRFFLASTAVLLSALGANPVLTRDVERSISTTIVTPTVDSNKKASTETPESKQGNANTSTAVTPAAPVTPDKSTSVASDKDKPSVSDKVEAPKTTPTTPTAPEKDKSEPSDSSSKVEPPKIAPIPSATPDKDKSGTSDSESSKPNQAEPEKKYGDVTVEYKSKDGTLIAPKELDTPTSEVGTDYDTTDQRKETITTVDGKKYKLDLKATQGAETGKVVEGNTNITYYYDLVPDAPQKKYGDVTVEYKNKDGMTISPKVTDTPRSEVGTDYDTTDQRRETIISSEGKKYRLDLKATQGYEKGKVLEGNTNITYYYDLVTETPDSNKVLPPKADPAPPDKDIPSTPDSSSKVVPSQDKAQVPSVPATPSSDSSVSPDTSIADTIAPTDTIPTDEAIDAKDTVNPSILTEKGTDETTISDMDLKKDETFSLDNASSVTTKKGDTIDNPIKSIISPADPLLTDKGFEIIGNDQGEVTIKNADGSKTSVPAAQVGARANPDGTVTVKSSNGKFTLLPDTGEATTILATIGLFILALLGFKKVKPFEKDNWLIR